MPLPNPKKEETKNEFIQRCMKESKFPDEGQRFAICTRQWGNKK